MAEKSYPSGQYVAGESLGLGDYLLKTEPDIRGRVEMFEDYDHFVSDDNFFYESFVGEYRVALWKHGVVVVICDAVFRKCEVEEQ